MINLLLYGTVVLVWGTTWYAIKFQLGVVSSEVSVGYRFLFAGILLLTYALITKPQQFKLLKDKQVLKWVSVQALFMFCLNYILVYIATAHLTSALVAVVFSLLTVLNAINAKIFLKQNMEPNAAIATILGFVGILVFFYKDILAANSEFILGAAIALASTYFASLGNIAAIKVRQFKVPIVPTTALGMTIGGALTLAIASVRGSAFNFDWSPNYIGSLLYLSVFGSIVAFLCYLNLLSRIGPSRAAYSSVLIPVVAIVISAFFENYKLSGMSFAGLTLVLLGNVFALSNRNYIGFLLSFVRKPTHPSELSKYKTDHYVKHNSSSHTESVS